MHGTLTGAFAFSWLAWAFPRSATTTGSAPSWRGFALPHLQERLTPVRATVLLGALWALWHLPILLAAEDSDHSLAIWGALALAALTLASIVGYAFAYTFLVNKTGSVLIAIAIHVSFNTANGFAGLGTRRRCKGTGYLLVLELSTATIWTLVAELIAVTAGTLAAACLGRPPNRYSESCHQRRASAPSGRLVMKSSRRRCSIT
jgi:hypothetical protein